MSLRNVRTFRSRRDLPGVRTISVLLLTCLCTAILGPLLPACPTAYAANPAVWSLVWSDEFDGPNGSAGDSSQLSFDVGGNGWGNNEPQTYTNRTPNAS